MKKKKRALTLILAAKLSLSPLTGSALAKHFIPELKEEKAKALLQLKSSSSEPEMKFCWVEDWRDDWQGEWGDAFDGGWIDWSDEGVGDECWGDWPG